MLEQRIDALVSDIDERVTRQLEVIQSHPSFQTLERRWSALFFMVDRIRFDENIRLEILNISQEDLVMDFEDSPEIMRSGLYKIVYSGEYGPFGGRPFGLMVADFELGMAMADTYLLEQCAAVAARACAVFVTAASTSLVGAPPDRFVRLQQQTITQYVGLVHPAIDGFGVAAFVVAAARSFALWRSCLHIAGLDDGRVDDLPAQSAVDREAAATLAARGFMALEVDPASGEAFFRRAPSMNVAPDVVAPGLEPEDSALQRELPLRFLVTRFAQHLKMLQRESIGSWGQLDVLERELSAYLSGYVSEHDAPVLSANGQELETLVAERPGDSASRAVFDDYLLERGVEAMYRSRTKHPLREARLTVADNGTPGVYDFELCLQPNWSADGRFFRIALSGVLDRE